MNDESGCMSPMLRQQQVGGVVVGHDQGLSLDWAAAMRRLALR
ncbi:MAG: hypothetical protein V9E89_09150 [Ilumatobacteraceae bacterium]